MVFEAGDRLITGRSARLLLRLKEGSHVKLGENTDFKVATFSTPKKRKRCIQGFLDCTQGRISVHDNGEIWHRLLIEHFGARKEADAFKERMIRDRDFARAWSFHE